MSRSCSLLTMLCSVGLLVACGSDARQEAVTVQPVSNEAHAEAEGGIQVRANTQATDGDLRIGVGNIWSEAYETEDGNSSEGLTAGLWLYFRDTPDMDRHVRAHPGQRIEAGAAVIEVLAVDAQSATLRITRPEPEPPAETDPGEADEVDG